MNFPMSAETVKSCRHTSLSPSTCGSGEDAVFCGREKVGAQVVYLLKIFPGGPEPDENLLYNFLSLIAVAAFSAGEAVKFCGIPAVDGLEGELVTFMQQFEELRVSVFFIPAHLLIERFEDIVRAVPLASS